MNSVNLLQTLNIKTIPETQFKMQKSMLKNLRS